MLNHVATYEAGGCDTDAASPVETRRTLLNELDDLELAVAAASGDRAAFETLLRRHYERIHAVAWRLTGSSHDADDITQEVCCALVTRLAGFKGEARFTTWLYGIVVNACRDHHRRRATLATLKNGLAVLVGLAAPPDGRDLFRRAWLTSELGRLDPSLRETIVLVVGEGLTHAEAGAVLGLAETTISWRLHEARRLLKDTPSTRDDRHGA
jgi:RNA polymerase sigma-70 factor (ECF subfamily)